MPFFVVTRARCRDEIEKNDGCLGVRLLGSAHALRVRAANAKYDECVTRDAAGLGPCGGLESDECNASVSARDAGRAEVMNVMVALCPMVEACGQGEHGEARVMFVFDGRTGHATSATVVGSVAGTPVGTCIENAVRRAHVQPFRQASFNVDFPYRF